MTSAEYRKLSILLSDIKNGSRELFSDVFAMYESKVYFLCCKLLKSKSAAKKMTIDLFNFVYLHITMYSNAAVFEKWLFTNLFIKCRRYLIENTPESFGDYIDTDSADGNKIDAILAEESDERLKFPDGIDISEDMMKVMDSILSEIPLKLRTVVLLHYFCNFDQNEIAATEQISLTAVKNRLYKAHIRLKTEEHKYSEMGYDIQNATLFLFGVLSTMADSIVVPSDIASGVTSSTGVNCLVRNFSPDMKPERYTEPYRHDVDPHERNTEFDDTAYVEVPPVEKHSSFSATEYATPVHSKKSFSQNISPSVKVLMAIVAILIIIGGTVAVVLAVQGRHPSNEGGSVADSQVTTQPRTIEVTAKETTSEAPTTEAVSETTTEPVTETTTEPTTVTTTQPETQPTTDPPTTEPTTAAPEPEGGEDVFDDDVPGNEQGVIYE